MATIVYLHGFNSKGVSQKSDALIDVFGADSVLRPDLPIDPVQLVKQVTEMVHQRDSFPVVFVGTSLGGFWANYFAQKFDAPCVIVNPVVSPAVRLREGRLLSTSMVSGEKVEVTRDMLSAFEKYKIEAESLYNGALVHVFLAKDDAVLNYQEAEHYFSFNRSIELYESGGHRFMDDWGDVVEKVRSLVYPEV